MKLSALIPLVLVMSSAVAAQQPATAHPIQDNSFLLEEAYNQEAGVVQHISSFTRLWASKDWAFAFTQEWPVPRHERHQISYTLVATDPGSFAGGAGIGDTYLNYRYQLIGDGNARLAFAPRVSLAIPTGASRLGRGAGGTGVQVNLPVSLMLTDHLVTHWNAGTTLIPNASNAGGERAATTSFNLGQSLIWLAAPRFNVMLEAVWNRNQFVSAPARTGRVDTVTLNPAIRWAHRFQNGLEIVPGIGIPIGVGPSAGERGVFLYLSFEHPLWREK